MTRYRLLIASGSPWTLRAVAGDLAREGYEMAGAGSLREATRICDFFQPDLVILDHPLLDTGTTDSFQALRVAGTSFLILTSRDLLLDKLPGLRPELDDYQTKPFSPAELALRVETVLCRRSFLANLTPDHLPDQQADPHKAKVRGTRRRGKLTGGESGLLGAVIVKPNPALARLQFSSC